MAIWKISFFISGVKEDEKDLDDFLWEHFFISSQSHSYNSVYYETPEIWKVDFTMSDISERSIALDIVNDSNPGLSELDGFKIELLKLQKEDYDGVDIAQKEREERWQNQRD